MKTTFLTVAAALAITAGLTGCSNTSPVETDQPTTSVSCPSFSAECGVMTGEGGNVPNDERCASFAAGCVVTGEGGNVPAQTSLTDIVGDGGFVGPVTR